MDLHSLPLGKHAPERLNAVIEIPTGSHNKYEYDHELGVMKLDRVLFSPFFYPIDYGFFPQTLADDGDPLDVLLVTDFPLFSGCVCEVRPVGLLKMSDDKGGDDKILAVPADHPRYAHIGELADVAPHLLKEIIHFFSHYKDLENKAVSVEGWHGRQEAYAVIAAAQANFKA